MLVEKAVRDFRMLLDTEDAGMSTNLMNGSGWEGPAPDIVSELVQPGWTVIEMGACLGFYAMIEANEGAIVYVIEPDPHNIEIIQANIKLNEFYSAIAFKLAISDKDGYASFRPSPTRSDRGKLSEDGKMDVETVTLDSFVARQGIEKVDMLRFDIEGAEVELVKGGQDTLGRMKKGSWIFADIHPMKVKDPLVNLLPALENVLEHGFVPRHVLAPDRYTNLPLGKFADAICRFKGFPKVFFEKVK